MTRTIFIFIDGLGMGSVDPALNPIYRGDYPVLQRMLNEWAQPIDALLDMPGTPQSATGQATIFTGQNGAALCGRHMEGFPGPTLREMVREQNIFKQLLRRGYTCTFANAYYLEHLEEITKAPRKSVTTVATLSALGTVRLAADLRANRAVYQDITRAVLRKRGHDLPTVTPEEAAHHLIDLAQEVDFTLFEYFQTDLMAHKGGPEDMERVLGDLDRFLSVLIAEVPLKKDHLLVITSDHGNIEDGSHRQHTRNPVPFVALGHGAPALKEKVHRLIGITPALMDLYPSMD